MVKQFPTEQDTHQAERIVEQAQELGLKKLADEIQGAFFESSSIAEFLDRVAHYTWYDVRNRMALMALARTQEQFVKAYVDDVVHVGTISPGRVGSWKSFVRHSIKAAAKSAL